jgi:CRISP-associated protein Cas1
MMPLRWKGTGRKSIPPAWHHVVARPSMVSGRNRHATHPVNAMLNYAYVVLESQVRIGTVAQGLDPTIGYLHSCRPLRVALVYDLMEPLRPRIDSSVLSFLHSHTFAPSDFALGTNGVCRLHSQLVKVQRCLVGRVVHGLTATVTITRANMGEYPETHNR